MFTRNGRQLTLAARQDDAPFRPSATLPAGAQPLTSTDVEGSTVSVTDDAACWSYDGWNYMLTADAGTDLAGVVHDLSAVDPT